MNDLEKIGIKEKILKASSIAEISRLLVKAKSFLRAHPKTIRKWERAAHKRRKELRS